jgi:hypothetical protein
MQEIIVTQNQAIDVARNSKLPRHVEVRIFLDEIPDTVKKRVKVALKRGFLLAWTGPAAELYDFLGTAFKFPAIRVRRERYSYAGIPPWRFTWGDRAVPAKMQELFTADEVAIRMHDDAKQKEYMQRYTSWGGYKTLYMLKDVKLLEEAFEEAVLPHKDQIQAAIDALDAGATLTVTHL